MSRLTRKEFAAVKYIVYLQFAAMILSNDSDKVDDLIRYGFDTLYPKLTWFDKVTALDICVQAFDEPPAYMSNILDKLAVELLYTSY